MARLRADPCQRNPRRLPRCTRWTRLARRIRFRKRGSWRPAVSWAARCRASLSPCGRGAIDAGFTAGPREAGGRPESGGIHRLQRRAEKSYEHSARDVPLIDATSGSRGLQSGSVGMALNLYRRAFSIWKRENGQLCGHMDGTVRLLPPDVAMPRGISDAAHRYCKPIAMQSTRDDWSVAQSALGNGGRGALPVRKPGFNAGDYIQDVAGSQGIRLRT